MMNKCARGNCKNRDSRSLPLPFIRYDNSRNGTFLPRQGMNRFGGALDSAEEAGLMIVGDEFSEIEG